MNYKSEIWKDIVGYEGLYQVSSYGKIKSILKNKLIYQEVGNVGYKVVALYKNNKRKKVTVHRIVAKAFIPNLKNLPQVNHIDGNKLNNCVENLEWCDNRYNQIHANKLGLNSKRNFITSYLNGKKVLQYDLNGKFIKEWKSIKEASRILKIDNSCISKCCYHKRNKCGGYIWRFYEEVVKNGI